MQLFVTEPGSVIAVEGGRFCVRKKEETHYFPVHEVSSIYMHKGVSLTYDAILLAVENETDLLVIGQHGKPAARMWSEKPGTISTARKNQLAFSRSDAPRAEWIAALLRYKITQQILLVELCGTMYPGIGVSAEKTIETLEKQMGKIKYNPDQSVQEQLEKWRGHEGTASRNYFSYISSILPEEYRFQKRTRHATDRFNAMLNYCYGILYARVEGALLRAGLDPYIGLFHRDEYNRPVLVYDCIEKYRVWADYTVLHLAMQQVMHLDFFYLSDEGYLTIDEHARRILVRAFFDYLEEITEINNLERSRLHHIDLDCQQLATFFKNFQI
jgi:CRISPR-associated protein Cas1